MVRLAEVDREDTRLDRCVGEGAARPQLCVSDCVGLDILSIIRSVSSISDLTNASRAPEVNAECD